MCWVILQQQINWLTIFTKSIPYLKNAFEQFYDDFRKKFPTKFTNANLPRCFNENKTISPGFVIFRILNKVLSIQNKDNYHQELASDEYYYYYVELMQKINFKIRNHNDIYIFTNHKINVDRITRLLKYLIQLIDICISYKKEILFVYHLDQSLSPNSKERKQRFTTIKYEKLFGTICSQINIKINKLNQELQDYLTRIIISPAVYLRRGLTRQESFIELSSLAHCCKNTWKYFIDNINGKMDLNTNLVSELLSQDIHKKYFIVYNTFYLIIMGLAKYKSEVAKTKNILECETQLCTKNYKQLKVPYVVITTLLAIITILFALLAHV